MEFNGKNLLSEIFLYRFFIGALIFFHLLYFLCFINISIFNEKFVYLLNNFIQFFVCIFLLVKYNPLRKPDFNKNDSFLIFTSASFILFNIAFNLGLQKFLDDYKQNISNIINK